MSKQLGWILSYAIAILSCFLNMILIGAYNLYHFGGSDLRDDTEVGRF